MIMVFGHRNPDTDSICSSIAMTALMNLQGRESEACRLGPLNKESRFVLEYFGVEHPRLISDVKTQIHDINFDRVEGVLPSASIGTVFKLMHEEDYRSVAVVRPDGTLYGLVTMHDIALSMIRGDIYRIDTSKEILLSELDGEELNPCADQFSGEIVVGAYYEVNENLLKRLGPETILIVGDRYTVIENAISRGVKLILVSGNHDLPDQLKAAATVAGTSLIRTPMDSYTLAKILTRCNRVSTIASKENLNLFLEDSLLEVALEQIRGSTHSNFPVVDKNNLFKGLIGRRHILFNTKGKEVILVDHNESSQSAKGIEQANIVAVIDHHKIGDTVSQMPITFRNEPVGSTCTVVSKLYIENGMAPPKKIAGLLLAGILSDTLNFTSPTTTLEDRMAVQRLAHAVDGNINEFVHEMFRVGSSIDPSEKMSDLCRMDLKVFEVAGKKMAISQIYTMDQQSVTSREAEILTTLGDIYRSDNYLVTMLVVTNIIAGGSYVYYHAEDATISRRILGDEAYQGIYMPGVVSRKKQIVPELLQKIQQE